MIRHTLCALLACFFVHSSLAGPWMDAGDERLRHHVQVLADSGIIRSPISSWPLMWSAVIQQAKAAEPKQLSETQRWSLQYLLHAFRSQAAPGIHSSSQISAATKLDIVGGFATDQREKNHAMVKTSWVGERLALQIQAGHHRDALDSKDYRLDGSYISWLLGNWALSAGAVDRWWGPGWAHSLILSHHARPVPALSLSRNHAAAFASPWLSWLGPWDFSAFIGQMESQRAVPDTKLLGARLSLRPVPAVEIGLSRAAQWGGQGRPQSLSSLKNLILGNDNTGDNGINRANEPGNQQGGIDVRLSLPLGELRPALYGQWVGEDESGFAPSRAIAMGGLELSFSHATVQSRLHLEAADTTTEFYGSERPNVAYEHSTYRSGYRYRGRPLGASLDNDSRSLSLAGDHYLANGQQISWQLAKLQINRDGSNRAAPGGNVYGSQALDIDYARLSLSGNLGKHWRATATAFYYSQPLQLQGEPVDSGLRLSLDYRL